MDSGNKKRHPPCAAMEVPPQTVHVLYAMRNGRLYRSTDGVNWKFRRNPALAALVAEGTTLERIRRRQYQA